MTQILICTISGFSASSRKSADTLDGFMGDVLIDMGDDCPEGPQMPHLYSHNKDCVEDLTRAAMSSKCYKVLIVGKSMGAVKVWWALTKYWAHFKLKLAHPDTKLGVVLLDPHGCQVGDGRIGAYGGRLRALKYLPAWNMENVRIRTVFQRNKKPKGARMYTAGVPCNNLKNTYLSHKADHWNITDIKTESGRKCADAIQEMIGWLDE